MKEFDLEILSLLANIINYIIFVFISLSLIGTKCFNQSQMLFTVFGLIILVGIQLVSIIIKKY